MHVEMGRVDCAEPDGMPMKREQFPTGKVDDVVVRDRCRFDASLSLMDSKLFGQAQSQVAAMEEDRLALAKRENERLTVDVATTPAQRRRS